MSEYWHGFYQGAIATLFASAAYVWLLIVIADYNYELEEKERDEP
jgi:hypothetical protein